MRSHPTTEGSASARQLSPHFRRMPPVEHPMHELSIAMSIVDLAQEEAMNVETSRSTLSIWSSEPYLASSRKHCSFPMKWHAAAHDSKVPDS